MRHDERLFAVSLIGQMMVYGDIRLADILLRAELDDPFVGEIDRSVMSLVRPQDAGGLSKGGMDSKLRAAAACVQAGCNVVVADGKRPDVLLRIVGGEDEGTLFPAMPQ